MTHTDLSFSVDVLLCDAVASNEDVLIACHALLPVEEERLCDKHKVRLGRSPINLHPGRGGGVLP